MRSLICLIVVGVFGFVAAADEPKVKVLNDFESEADLRAWSVKHNSAKLSDQHVTHGSHSVVIAPDEYLNANGLPRDWSGYDALELDAFVDGDGPVGGTVLVGDEAWAKKGGTYWNRHNGTFNLRPGANTISVPVNGLWRGEAGSRNNDIKSNVDPRHVVRLDFGFQPKGGAGSVRAIYLDHLRLVKESRPEGILAFDFGPDNQAVFPGFTAVGPNAVYGQGGVTAGLKWSPGANAARDDTFPTRLYQDAINLEGNVFTVDGPNGDYGVWLVYDDLGYWGGEEATYTHREVVNDGKAVYAEDRPDGETAYLYSFEKIEPKPGDDLWDLYVSKLVAPKRFKAKAVDGKLSLLFRSNGANASRVAALVAYPLARESEAAAWVADVERRNREEFEGRAVFLGPKQKDLAVPAAALARGWWVGFPTLEQDVAFTDAPGGEGKLARVAARGQRVSFTFAVRPLKDFSTAPAQLSVTDLRSSAGGVISARDVDLRYVHHAVHRGFNDIAYTIAPEMLRPVSGAGLKLGANLTRQFWITVRVPADAPAGTYAGTVTLTAGDLREEIPLKVDVLGVALDETDYLIGLYGTDVPRQVLKQRGDDAWRELFRLLKENGMNSLAGGPGIPFSGFDDAGKPKLDFTACDQYFALVRQAGFDKALNGYPSLSMPLGLHDGYVIGETGRAWERKTGKSFDELLKIVWGAIEEHAKANDWPHVQVNLTDEPRVIEQAKAQLELMQAYARAVPQVDFGGSYSVKWDGDDPFDRAVQEIFKTLRWSGLNLHTQADLDKGREFGRTVLIYNQGTSRYSFGAYQWAEMRKGVRGRFQWHLLALHGYQFFDLDGREPDTAYVNWGRDGLIPTLRLPRAREGTDDFRFAVTLWNLAQKHKGEREADAATAWLDGIAKQIPVGANRRPEGVMDDEAFRAGCAERISTCVKSEARSQKPEETPKTEHPKP